MAVPRNLRSACFHKVVDENMTYILVDTSIKDSSAKEIESLRKENVY
jgi:hypothetical protein